MEIYRLAADEPVIQEQIKALVFACDQEFYPPLSSRTSSTQSHLNTSDSVKEDGPLTYYEEIKKQSFIVAVEDSKLIGFLTYIQDYQQAVFAEYCPGCNNHYVTTICVTKANRGQKISHQLYEELEKQTASTINSVVSTRTWSENYSHINVLEKRDYQMIYQLNNHRGEGIHTLYFAKQIM